MGGEGRGGWKDRGRGRQRGREGEEEEGMRQSPNNTHVLGSGHCGPGIYWDLFDCISSLC